MRRGLTILLGMALVLGSTTLPAVAAQASPSVRTTTASSGDLRTASATAVRRQLRAAIEKNGLELGPGGRVEHADGSSSAAKGARATATKSGARALAARADVAGGASSITFGDLDEGTVVSSQYAPQGVVFSGPDADTPVFVAGDSSDPTSPALSGTPLYNGDIFGTFVKPGTSTPVIVSDFSIDVGYIDDPGSTEVVAYSTSGIQVLKADYTGYGTLTSTIGNVYGFVVKEVSTEQAGFDVDNLTFVPGATPVGGLGGGLVAASETFGGSNPAEPRCSCSVGWQGDPVNTANGDLVEKATDIAVAGQGPALGVSRTYNSLATRSNGLFGHGWSSLLDMSVAIDPTSGNATVTQASGATAIYVPSPAGFLAAPRVTATLTGDSTDGYRFATDDGLTYGFSSAGLISSVTDRNGRALSITRPTASSIVLTADSGRSISFTLQGGRITSATDPAKATVRYGYSSGGDLTRVTDRVGALTRYGYSAHRLTTIVNGVGATVTDRYDSKGRVIRQTNARGGVTTFDYSSLKSATKVTDPDHHVTVDAYTNGLMTSRTRAYGTKLAATTKYEYDPLSGGATKVTDPLGHRTTTTYDRRGNALTSTDALGRTTTTTYNAFGEPTSVTDPLGIATTYDYDSAGNLTDVSRPIDGSSTATLQYTYGSGADAGDVVGSTDADGNGTVFTRDASGSPVTVTDPMGGVTTTTYDADGRPTSSTTPGGHRTTYGYDREGRVVRVVDPIGHVTRTSYDRAGRKTSVKDAAGRTTRYRYDADGDLIRTTASNGEVTRTTYDADGNPTAKIDAKRHARKYTYNALGLVATSAEANGARTTYGYDRAGRVTAVTDPLRRVTKRVYDANGRLTAVTYSDHRTAAVSSVFDADGRRIAMKDGTGRSATTYDGLGRVVAQVDGHGQKTTFTLDPAGNVTALGYPNGRSVTRTFDADGRLTAVADWNGATSDFDYDADGNLLTTRAGSAAVIRSTYDADGLVKTSTATTTTGGVLAGLGYRRNALSELTKETDSGALRASRTFSYDAVNRVTADTAGKATYRYDAAGNPIGFAKAKQSFDAADQLTRRTAGGRTTTYAYDKAGERVSSTTTSERTAYGYDQAGNLTAVSKQSKRAKTASTTHYRYDGDGVRASATPSRGHTTYFSYDTTGTVPALLSDGVRSYVYGPGGQPLEQISAGGAVDYFFHDQIGSTRALISVHGDVVDSIAYTAYGAATQHGSVRTPLTFSGAYQDAGTGLLYLVHRYLDTSTGQFLSVDPLVALTQTAYGYAGGNPIADLDPLGWNSWSFWLGTAATVLGVTGLVLDATGVGAVAGVPLDAIAVGLDVASVAAGAGAGAIDCGFTGEKVDEVGCATDAVALLPGFGGLAADSLKAGSKTLGLGEKTLQTVDTIGRTSVVTGAGVGGFGIGYGGAGLLFGEGESADASEVQVC